MLCSHVHTSRYIKAALNLRVTSSYAVYHDCRPNYVTKLQTDWDKLLVGERPKSILSVLYVLWTYLGISLRFEVTGHCMFSSRFSVRIGRKSFSQYLTTCQGRVERSEDLTRSCGEEWGPDMVVWWGVRTWEGRVERSEDLTRSCGEEWGPDMVVWRGVRTWQGRVERSEDLAWSCGEEWEPVKVAWRGVRTCKGRVERSEDLSRSCGIL